jgi:hypothetical protein
VRCSQLRPKWRTTGRVWVTHRRTLLGWITRTVSSAATQIGVGPKCPARSSAAGLLGGILIQMSNWTSRGQLEWELDIKCPHPAG